jgi:hypothetical protein
MNYLKQPVHRSKEWLKAVASLPCVRCGCEGHTQAAHRDQGKGMGMKTDDCLTAALCVDCHFALGTSAQWSKQEKREQMDEAILKTLVQLARRGMVKT